MSIKNVAVFGGAFDPVHRDHATVANICLKKGLCDEVWFIPSPDRWDKQLNASAEDRFAMLKMSIEASAQELQIPKDRFFISDWEIQMGDYRGSYVSMSMLREANPNCNIRLLIGADSYAGIPHWRDPMNFYGTNYNGHLLLKDFELIVFSRNGSEDPDIEKHLDKGYAPLYLVGEADGFIGKYASSEIRRQLLKHRNQQPEGLLPKVYQYIIDNGIYNE